MNKKNKKVLSIFATIMACVLLIGALGGCSFKKPIDKMREDIYESGNYEIKMTMENVPLFGTMAVTTQVDGDITYTPASGLQSENYTQNVDGVKYKYEKNEEGSWVKTQEPKNETSEENAPEDILYSDNFEKVPNTDNQYRLIDGVTLDGMTDVVVTINEESYSISGYMSLGEGGEDDLFGGEMKVKTTMEFSKFGQIELELPEVK